jgi:hypothetical protein
VPPGAEQAPAVIDSAEELAARLRGRRPAFFDETGDRLGGRGEYVVALRPEIRDTGGGTEVLSSAKLEVWTRDELATAARRREGTGVAALLAPTAPRPRAPATTWKLIKSLVIEHGRSPHPGTP